MLSTASSPDKTPTGQVGDFFNNEPSSEKALNEHVAISASLAIAKSKRSVAKFLSI